MKGDVWTQAGAEGGSPRGDRGTRGATGTGERQVPSGEHPCPKIRFDSGPRARENNSLLLCATGWSVSHPLQLTQGTRFYRAENN